jgi:hypothetical protein
MTATTGLADCVMQSVDQALPAVSALARPSSA